MVSHGLGCVGLHLYGPADVAPQKGSGVRDRAMMQGPNIARRSIGLRPSKSAQSERARRSIKSSSTQVKPPARLVSTSQPSLSRPLFFTTLRSITNSTFTKIQTDIVAFGVLARSAQSERSAHIDRPLPSDKRSVSWSPSSR